MEEKLEKLQASSPQVGKKCIVCEKLVQAGEEIVDCPRCHSIHHADCWKDKGGCGKTGCRQLAINVVGEKPQGDGPPPPLPKKYVYGGIGLALILILTVFFWPKPPDPAMGRTKIQFMTEASIDEQQVIGQIVDEFNNNHPDIYIDLQMLPYGGMDTKFIVLMAAGETPDIFTMPQPRKQMLIESNALLDLASGQDEPVYSVQHPGQLTEIGIFSQTEHVDEALEVFNYLLDNLPEADLDELRSRQQGSTQMPVTGPMGF